MKKKLLWLLCLFMLSLPLFAQTRAELQNMYLSYLRSQNIEATVDPDGDIRFEYDLSQYPAVPFYIIVDEADPGFFQIALFNIYSLDNAQERDQAYIEAAYASRFPDTLKVYVNSSGTDVIISGEVFLASPGDFRFAFPKMMLQFDTAIDAFYSFMQQ